MQFAWLIRGLRTGIMTTRYPREPETLPTGFRGRPALDAGRCRAADGCAACVQVCLPRAITLEQRVGGGATGRVGEGATEGSGDVPARGQKSNSGIGGETPAIPTADPAVNESVAASPRRPLADSPTRPVDPSPTRPLAVSGEGGGGVRFNLNYGACIMCGLCVAACPSAALSMTTEYELAVRRPDDLIFTTTLTRGGADGGPTDSRDAN
ncbi:MAG TPA: 4Fe-4S binding protein [Chloroflexota bacterium]|nr:4Fe-4S binding protein [Chloroflexota bacterium]